MSFDVSQPFVERVYALIGQGELDECELMLRELLRQETPTQFHCALDLDSKRFLPGLGNWLRSGCAGEPALDSSTAISVSMGEFEINYDNWTVDAVICEGYDNPPCKYSWLAESSSESLCDWHLIEGMEDLRQAFKMEDEWAIGGSTGAPPCSPLVYTTTCYLFFTLFLQVLRRIQEESNRNNQPLARVNLFGSYGDCLFHSKPLR